MRPQPAEARRRRDQVCRAVAAWSALPIAFALAFADLMALGDPDRGRAILVPVWSSRSGAAATPELQHQQVSRIRFLPWGRAPKSSSCFVFVGLSVPSPCQLSSQWRPRLLRRRYSHRPSPVSCHQHGGAMLRRVISADTGPAWVAPTRSTIAATRWHEDRPNGQGIAALIAWASWRAVRSCDRRWTAADAQHLQIGRSTPFATCIATRGSVVDDVTRRQMLRWRLPASRARRSPSSARSRSQRQPVLGGTIYGPAADETRLM